MGKAKKAKKVRDKDEPYDASFAGSLAKLDAAGDVAAMAEQKDDVKTLTKGELQKRQNLEWKRLRASLQELGKEKRSYSNADPAEKREKKDLRKYMIGLKTAMKERHQKELETWDTKQVEKKTQSEMESIPKPKLSIAEQASLKNMFAHLTQDFS